MGDIADYYLDMYEGYDDGSDPNYSVWVTREGEEIPLTEMTDSHLVNAINYSNRMGMTDWLIALMDEKERRSR